VKPTFSILIPTFNNPELLNSCVRSIVSTGATISGKAKLIIVNNGKQPCKQEFAHLKNVVVLDAEDNLGWEGGLKLGMTEAEGDFVCFQNDDTFLPFTSHKFYDHLLTPFQDESVAAVGPMTTTAAGLQSIYHPRAVPVPVEAPYLIFFTVMVRRSSLDEVGGIDDTLPGGDDIDLSMRFRYAGKKVLINPNAFLIHHGFKTGTRVKGDHTVDGGWNSPQMTERTNMALIKKHGFKKFAETLIYGQYKEYSTRTAMDIEGDLIRTMVKSDDVVLELGCGYRKTIEKSVGMDIVPLGETIPHADMQPSVADVTGDVTKILPFEDKEFDVIIARHILEHCLDTVKTISQWTEKLRIGGRLIVAVPDERVTAGIPLDSTHVHAFTPDSLKHIAEKCGLEELSDQSAENGISFVSVFRRVA